MKKQYKLKVHWYTQHSARTFWRSFLLLIQAASVFLEKLANMIKVLSFWWKHENLVMFLKIQHFPQTVSNKCLLFFLLHWKADTQKKSNIRKFPLGSLCLLVDLRKEFLEKDSQCEDKWNNYIGHSTLLGTSDAHSGFVKMEWIFTGEFRVTAVVMQLIVLLCVVSSRAYIMNKDWSILVGLNFFLKKWEILVSILIEKLWWILQCTKQVCKPVQVIVYRQNNPTLAPSQRQASIMRK